MKNGEPNINLEKALDELEKIVYKLESGNLTIEESLKEFERGVELYRQCYNIINLIEGKVKVLINNDNNEMNEANF